MPTNSLINVTWNSLEILHQHRLNTLNIDSNQMGNRNIPTNTQRYYNFKISAPNVKMFCEVSASKV